MARSKAKRADRWQLFVNFTLAGTLIFGGGPVVVPMLRDYVVAPGMCSPAASDRWAERRATETGSGLTE